MSNVIELMYTHGHVVRFTIGRAFSLEDYVFWASQNDIVLEGPLEQLEFVPWGGDWTPSQREVRIYPAEGGLFRIKNCDWAVEYNSGPNMTLGTAVTITVTGPGTYSYGTPTMHPVVGTMRLRIKKYSWTSAEWTTHGALHP